MTRTRGPCEFGMLVRSYRAAAGLSQDELAERASLSRRGISDLERGERVSPHPSTVRRLAEALQLSTADREVLLAIARRGISTRSAPIVGLPPLPIPPSSFIGREQELDEVRRLLRSTRLLTITGAGGSGKTRLALEAARASADDYADGVALVLLAPLTDADQVGPAIAQVLGVRDIVDQPWSETLTGHLHPRRLLLVLDNFEHLLDAGPLVSQLLAACSRLAVLCTSREGLHVREEQEFKLLPLQLPEMGRDVPPRILMKCPSVELFADRSARFLPDFKVNPDNARIVADICVRLDGLPLAIELAAARTRVLSPALLLERLGSRLPLLVGGARDLPSRQRTLRDAIAWSHELLSPGDRHLFRRLAVCVGGCTLEAAEALSSNSSGPCTSSAIDQLQSLVEKNLLERGAGADHEPRFTMLETIREYAHEQLEASHDLEEAQRRHALYYLSWLAPGDARRLSEHPRGWIRRLDLDFDNARAAVTWSLKNGYVSLVLAAAPALTRYGHLRGYLRELRVWWQEALDRSANGDPADWPTAAVLLALVLFVQRDEQPVFSLLEESLARFRGLHNIRGMAHVLLQLGSAAPLRGDPADGIPMLQQAEALFRELNQQEDVVWSVWNRGNIAQIQGDLALAELLYTDALTIGRNVRQPANVAQAIGLEGLEVSILISLGSLALMRGDLDASEEYLREAGHLGLELASPELLAVCVLHLAGVALGHGHFARAARLLGGAEGLLGAVDSGMLPVHRLMYDRICKDLGQNRGESVKRTRAEGRRMSLHAIGVYALAPRARSDTGDPLEALTRREREVAQLAAGGLSNREIARALAVAEGTARIHVERALGKLDLHSRSQLAAWAVQHGVAVSGPG
jgi:predicted ATPase/DNA-binding CsgD family transcriptional regulator/DNA-binding XRE family transcriptional regulator